MSLYNKLLGADGESKALRYLKKKGYKFCDKNYSTRFGEIDLIMKQSNTIVFVEVKTRSSMKFGAPAEAVSFKKRQSILTVAQQYLQDKGFADIDIRFDVVEVVGENINHIENAFDF